MSRIPIRNCLNETVILTQIHKADFKHMIRGRVMVHTMEEKLRAYIIEAKEIVQLQRAIIDEQRVHIEHLRQEATDCRTKLHAALKMKHDRLNNMEKMVADILDAKQKTLQAEKKT